MKTSQLLLLKIEQLTDEVQSIKQLLLKKKKQPECTETGFKYLTVKEAATFLDLSYSTIYKLVHFKKLTPIQRIKRGRLLFSIQELNRFLNHQSL